MAEMYLSEVLKSSATFYDKVGIKCIIDLHFMKKLSPILDKIGQNISFKVAPNSVNTKGFRCDSHNNIRESTYFKDILKPWIARINIMHLNSELQICLVKGVNGTNVLINILPYDQRPLMSYKVNEASTETVVVHLKW